METKFIAAQTQSTGLIGPWLALGVRDNILHHSVNETYTAAVFQMTRMRQEYPENYTQVSPALSPTGICKMSLPRGGHGGTARHTPPVYQGNRPPHGFDRHPNSGRGRTIAIIGAMLFTAIQANFLIIGNHFCYGFCHEWAQSTHYQMTLWGLGTMIPLGLS